MLGSLRWWTLYALRILFYHWLMNNNNRKKKKRSQIITKLLFSWCPGERCEVRLDPCESQPCQSGATCVTLPTEGFLCKCPPGRTGTLCDQSESACLSLCSYMQYEREREEMNQASNGVFYAYRYSWYSYKSITAMTFLFWLRFLFALQVLIFHWKSEEKQ